MPAAGPSSGSQNVASAALLVAALACVPYALLPANPLLYDGPLATTANRAVQSGPLVDLFSVDFWGFPLRAEVGTRSYRPLVSLSYALQARTLGNAAALYHLTDMLLHAVAAGLLVLLVSRFGIGRPWLWLAGLLFAWHPVLTDAVCSTVGRADILGSGCLLAALLAHLEAPRRVRPLIWQAGALVLLACGFLCKEYAVTFPFILLVVDLARRYGHLRSEVESRIAWRVTAGSFVLLSAYLGLRLLLFGALGGVPSLAEDDHPLVGQPLDVRWGTASLLLPLSARLLALPYALNHHYRFGTIPIASGLFDPRSLVGIALVLGLLGSSAWLLLRRRLAVPAVAVALFLLPLGPSLNTVSLSGVLFAERFLYLPACGLALFVGWAAQSAGAAPQRRRVAVGACAALLLLFVGLAARRVHSWGSLERLARSSLAAYPGGSEVWRQLGMSLEVQGRHREARDAFRRSVELNPLSAPTWKHLADALQALGEDREAVEAWRKTTDLSPPRIGVLWLGRGEAELRAGLTADAVQSLQRAHDLLPADPQSLFRLGEALLGMGDLETAVHVLREGGQARAGDPKALDSLLSQSLLRLAEVRLRAGRRDEALKLAAEAIAVEHVPPQAFDAAASIK